MTVTWKVEIDWEASGTFTDEAGRLLSLSVRRGRDATVSGDSLEHVRPGELDVTLENHDGRYDPYNTGSDLYGYILPNRIIQVSVENGTNIVPVFYGRIRDIRPQEQRSRVRIVASDGLEILERQKASNLNLQTDYAVTDAIVALLNLAGWENTDTSGWTFPTELGVDSYLGSAAIEDNGDTMPYWWGDPEITVLEAINEIADAYGGDIYIAADGTFSYNARNYNQASVLTLDQSQIQRDIEMNQPWDEIRNSIKVVAYPRTATSSMDIWKLGDVPYIPAGGTLTIWAEYSYDGDISPASSVTTPAATTDYLANTVEDGSGTNATASVTITMTDYATEAKLVIVNNYSSGVYITLCKLRGVLLIAQNAVIAIEENTASIADYGRNDLNISTRWIQDSVTAINRAGYADVMHASPKKICFVRLEEQENLQYAMDLFRYLDLTIAKLGIDGQYCVTAINHEYLAGRGCITTWRLEPTARELGSFWVFPAALGEGTVLGW